MLRLGRAAQRVAMPVADAVPLIDEIEMGVDMDDMDGTPAVEGLDDRRVNRMVAAENDGKRPGFQDLADGKARILVALRRVGMDDVGIAEIDDAQLVARQVEGVVISAAVSEGEERRRLADGARPEARARAVLRPLIVRDAEDRGIGSDIVPIGADRLLAEGAMADEGQIEPTLFITMHSHCRSSPEFAARL